MKKDDKLLEIARKRFKDAQEYENDNRVLMVDDLEFKLGNQWPDNIRQDREAHNKPILTINRMGQFVRQITGDIRQNRPAIRVRPVDDTTDPDTADIIEGLVRHIEHSSNAQHAYINAEDFAASCGYGVFKIKTDYCDDDTFNQDIKVCRIANPFTAYCDPAAEELTKKDAKYWFLTTRIDEDSFKEKYPDAEMTDFEEYHVGTRYDDWYSSEGVRISEYWVKEPDNKKIALLSNGETIEYREGMDETLAMEGLFVKDTRIARTHKVKQYIISGSEVLEGPYEWATKDIPIIPVYGEEHNIEGKTIYKGVIRDAKDPQRLYNYWRTTAAETIALQPKVPYKLTVEQVKGHERYWKAANKGDLPYLLYNADKNAPGTPQREMPPQPPSALWQEAQIATDDMKATTGIYDSALGAQSNETSGRAILARQRESDVGNYVFADNLSLAIQHAGRIIVDLIPKIYDTQRTVRILGEDGAEKAVTLNEVQPDGNVLYDLSVGKYDVRVETGPSYTTKRMESADSMMAFIQAYPQAGPLIGDLLAKNMDWPGANDIAERLKKAIPPGIVEPDDDNPEAQQQAQMMAQKQQQIEDMMLQMEMAQKEAEIANKEADTEQKRATAADKYASAEEKLDELDMKLNQIMQYITQGGDPYSQ